MARTGETVEIGLGRQPVSMATGIIARRHAGFPHRPAQRTDRAALARQALVWRAPLGARAVSSRAALTGSQGISRARVTQVLGLLRPRGISGPFSTIAPARLRSTVRNDLRRFRQSRGSDLLPKPAMSSAFHGLRIDHFSVAVRSALLEV